MRNVEVVFESGNVDMGKGRNEGHVAPEFAKGKNDHVGLIEPWVLVVKVNLKNRKILNK